MFAADRDALGRRFRLREKFGPVGGGAIQIRIEGRDVRRGPGCTRSSIQTQEEIRTRGGGSNSDSDRGEGTTRGIQYSAWDQVSAREREDDSEEGNRAGMRGRVGRRENGASSGEDECRIGDLGRRTYMDWLENEVGEVYGENRNWNQEQPRRSRGLGDTEAGPGRAKKNGGRKGETMRANGEEELEESATAKERRDHPATGWNHARGGGERVPRRNETRRAGKRENAPRRALPRASTAGRYDGRDTDTTQDPRAHGLNSRVLSSLGLLRCGGALGVFLLGRGGGGASSRALIRDIGVVIGGGGREGRRARAASSSEEEESRSVRGSMTSQRIMTRSAASDRHPAASRKIQLCL
ncbi:hypothetical protein DFH09DRAFT_1105802 [Mycena vulgaris]|nr:hypothetical protein DFH09DRAFT_1105802 [Mycena vulgaris]